MTNDDVLFGYRLQLFALAAEIGVRPACRQMGVHHSTYYDWKRKVERHGLEMLPPAAANAEPAAGDDRGADRRLFARPLGARA